ncbi:hypothetical protein FS837_008124 [Tulasnella sp. UAMH 9824]|nr:hypothetical protein FS837_008124 [Tulasnella sp. UAMH 9824]
MGDLPETTARDLHVMGITPGMIKEAIEKTGKVIHGKIVRFSLPKDNHNHNPQIRRARNYLKSDWEFVAERPSIVVKEERYDENFSNFDEDKKTEFQFEKSVTITTGNDYTLTKSFDVSVNASIPLGLSGAMMGFTSSQSASEVKAHSTSTAETRKVSFDVEVPAGEGRAVSTVTTRTSTDNVFRAMLGVQGTVGIEVDPAWYLPNHHWWIYNIEKVFPNATASREIIRSRIDTKVDNIIRRIDGHKVGDIVECRSVVFPHPTPDGALLTEKLGGNLVENIGCEAALDFESESPAPSAFTAELVIQIDFRDTHPIDHGDRLSQVTALHMMVQAQIQPTGCIGVIGGVIWLPNTEEMTEATFSIPFDPTRITRDGLIEQFVQLKRTIAWNGSHQVNFI